MSNKIKTFGYELIEMWECDFDRDIKTNLQFFNYIKIHPLAQNISLNPRDASYGGRTGNIVTYFNAQDDETIKYYDVCSLYPFTCKTGIFPIGHPDIFVGDQSLNLTGLNFEYFHKNVEGLVKCEILPPTGLFHPVLPFRIHNKLLLPLSRSCCDNLSQGECFHNSVEIKKALELGYKLL